MLSAAIKEMSFVETLNDIEILVVQGIDIASVIDQELYAHFDVHAGPLVRGKIVWDENAWILLFTFNHIIADGISAAKFLINVIENIFHKRTNFLYYPIKLPVEHCFQIQSNKPNSNYDVEYNKSKLSEPVSQIIEYLNISTEILSRFKMKCKLTGVTFHSMITVLLAKALKSSLNNVSHTINSVHPVNMRKYLNNYITDDDFGYY